MVRSALNAGKATLWCGTQAQTRIPMAIQRLERQCINAHLIHSLASHPNFCAAPTPFILLPPMQFADPAD